LEEFFFGAEHVARLEAMDLKTSGDAPGRRAEQEHISFGF
jgi:hypothetical protein